MKGCRAMSFIRELLTSPLFIVKRLQKGTLKKYAHLLNGRVLDVGCGIKPYQGYLEFSGYIGIDESQSVSPDVLARSESLPFAGHSFDAVLCTEVLEHLKEPVRCLDEIKRVLKKGGCAYITVPQSWGLHYEPADYWRFTKYGITLLFEKCGFEVEGVARIGGVFSLIGQEAVDAGWTFVVRLFLFLGRRWAERLASLLFFPFSFVFYILGKCLDWVDPRFSIGWAIVGRSR